jgi:hypothetical protein
MISSARLQMPPPNAGDAPRTVRPAGRKQVPALYVPLTEYMLIAAGGALGSIARYWAGSS